MYATFCRGGEFSVLTTRDKIWVLADDQVSV